MESKSSPHPDPSHAALDDPRAVRRRMEELERQCREQQAELERHDARRARIEEFGGVLVHLARNDALRSGDLDGMLRQVVKASAHAIDVERVNVWMYTLERDAIACVAGYCRRSNTFGGQGMLTASENPAYFSALREDRVLAVSDAQHDPRTAGFTAAYLAPLGIGALLDAPIRLAGRVAGILCHEHAGGVREWTLDEQQFAGSLADLAALAFEGAERRRAEDALRAAHQELERRVEQRTRELQQANRSLQREQQWLQRLLALHEQDRKLVAYEIHDGLVQYAAGASMHLDAYLSGLDLSGLEDVGGESRKELDLARQLLRETIREARRMISGLRPMILDEMGVVSAIDYLISEHAQRGGQVKIEFQHKVRFHRLSPVLESNLFRIVQEALNNVQRHSGATRARVRLKQFGDRARLEIRDWGKGFSPSDVSTQSFGLEGIRQRVRLLEGTVVVRSKPGKGTLLRVDVPLLRPTSASDFSEPDTPPGLPSGDPSPSALRPNAG